MGTKSYNIENSYRINIGLDMEEDLYLDLINPYGKRIYYNYVRKTEWFKKHKIRVTLRDYHRTAKRNDVNSIRQAALYAQGLVNGNSKN